MWHHRFETRSDLTPEQIWPVIADVAAWGQVDHNIDTLIIREAPAVGVPFMLKPKGGPTLKFVIGDFAPPCRYSDICKMPFASMKTLHTLEEANGTIVRVDIEISGPLSALWGRLVGRKHAGGLAAQTARILAKAAQLKSVRG
jgi:Polyketide cyclase / dehydrase and lipid transport